MYSVTIKWKDGVMVDKTLSDCLPPQDKQMVSVMNEDGSTMATHFFENFSEANDFLNGKIIYNDVYIVYHRKGKRYKRFVRREYMDVDDSNKPYICIVTDDIHR